MRELCGIINIYKEKGYTSHDVVAIVRKLLGKVKTGHTGTLDPAAEGVLPVCIGRATKIADYIMSGTKGYRAVVKLGITTDTEDDTGITLSECRLIPDRLEIEQAAASFKGLYMQTPPMYSAIKVGGKKLYDLARQGVDVKRDPRQVIIEEIKIVEFLDNATFRIDVRCSKGTYIRTLCADIGQKLGCGACMGELLRYMNGDFLLENSIRISDLKEASADNSLQKFILPVEFALHRYNRVSVDKRFTGSLYNGNLILPSYLTEPASFSSGELVLVFDSNGVAAGLHVGCPNDSIICLKPVVMLNIN